MRTTGRRRLRYWKRPMHFRRLAALLTGAWLAAGAWIDIAAIQNFRSVERLLSAPGVMAAQQIHALGKENARGLLRRQAGEANRFLFEQWEYVEIALGLVLLLVLILGEGNPGRAALVIAASMLCIASVDRFWLTPYITSVNRSLDDVSQGSGGSALFWRLHGVYSSLELIKLSLGLGLAAALIARRKDRQRFAREYAVRAGGRDGAAV